MTCDEDTALIVSDINVSFIGPDNLQPILMLIGLIELSPGHACMPVRLCEEGDFSCDTSVVACTAEDMSNGCVAHIEAKLISDLAKRSSTLLSSSSDYKVFVGISKLWGTARTLMIFGCARCIIFFHDTTSCAIFQAKVQSSLSNNLPTKDSTRDRDGSASSG